METQEFRELIKIIVYFGNSNTIAPLYKTKLNKLLFYTQFIYFKKYEKRLLQSEFKYDYYGPILENLTNILLQLEEKNIIKIEENGFGQVIHSNVRLTSDSYTFEELNIINMVEQQFKGLTSAQISEYSHKESFWKEYERNKIIDIQIAKTLEEFKNTYGY